MSFYPAAIERNVYRGDTIKIPFHYKEGETLETVAGVSLTGATLSGQVRISADSETVVTTLEFDLDDQTQIATAGSGRVVIPEAKSALLLTSTVVFDVQVLWPNGETQTIFKGTLNVESDVTR